MQQHRPGIDVGRRALQRLPPTTNHAFRTSPAEDLLARGNVGMVPENLDCMLHLTTVAAAAADDDDSHLFARVFRGVYVHVLM